MGKSKDLFMKANEKYRQEAFDEQKAINKRREMEQTIAGYMKTPTPQEKRAPTIEDRIEKLEEKIDILIKLLGKTDEVETVKKLSE